MSTSTTPPAVAAWHALLRSRDAAALDALLAADVVLHSPVVHAPLAGKPVVIKYLSAALQVFVNDSFRYVRELVGAADAMLEFQVEIDGLQVNGVDMIRWDESGRIVDFKVMLRPLKAVKLIHARMAALVAGPLLPRSLVAMAEVADVPRSIAFYRQLGFKAAATHAPEEGAAPVWAHLESGDAHLMLAQSGGPVDAGQRAVLFYLYYPDIHATHAALAAAGLEVGTISYPFYCPGGEFQLLDPDGHCLMLTHT